MNGIQYLSYLGRHKSSVILCVFWTLLGIFSARMLFINSEFNVPTLYSSVLVLNTFVQITLFLRSWRMFFYFNTVALCCLIAVPPDFSTTG